MTNDLSTEAKVIIGAMFPFGSKTEVSFARPHIMTPQCRKGFDDLVEAGYLTVEKFNRFTDKLVWKPTEKMKDKPKISNKFIKDNTFFLTTE